MIADVVIINAGCDADRHMVDVEDRDATMYLVVATGDK